MTAFSKIKEQLPKLGIGLGLRRSIFEETLEAKDTIDWLEFVPENYLNKQGKSLKQLQEAAQAYPLISHGVNLSIGSADGLNKNYLNDLEQLFSWTNPAWFSDHLCFTQVNGLYLNDLIPLPRTQETIDTVVQNIDQLQQVIQKPFLLENISFYMESKELSPIEEIDFIGEITQRAECGLLLDVNNVYVNTQNLGGDPKDYIRQLPLDRVVQIHMAGHAQTETGLIDTHGSAVKQDVWDLLDWTLQHCSPNGLLLERDNNLPEFSELLEELRIMKNLWQKHCQQELAGLK